MGRGLSHRREKITFPSSAAPAVIYLECLFEEFYIIECEEGAAPSVTVPASAAAVADWFTPSSIIGCGGEIDGETRESV